MITLLLMAFVLICRESLSPGTSGFPATTLRHQSHGRPVLRRAARQPSCVTARAHSGGHARNGAQRVAWRAGGTALPRFARCSGAVQRSPQLASVNRNVSLLPVQSVPRTLAVLQGVEAGCFGRFPNAPCFVAAVALQSLLSQTTGLTHRSSGRPRATGLLRQHLAGAAAQLKR